MAAEMAQPGRGIAGDSIIDIVDFLECPVCMEPILEPRYFVTEPSEGGVFFFIFLFFLLFCFLSLPFSLFFLFISLFIFLM